MNTGYIVEALILGAMLTGILAGARALFPPFRQVVQCFVYAILWVEFVLPWAMWGLATGGVVATNPQFRIFLALSLPLQWWGLRLLIGLLGAIRMASWRSLRWVILRGLGLDPGIHYGPVRPVKRVMTWSAEPDVGLTFTGQYEEPKRWTV